MAITKEKTGYQAMADHHPVVAGHQQLAQAAISSDEIVKALTSKGAATTASISPDEAATRARIQSEQQLLSKDPSASGTTVEEMRRLSELQAARRKNQPVLK